MANNRTNLHAAASELMETAVVTPEALVALKLEAMASNPKRRSKDRPDVVSVLESTPNFDYNELYIYLSAEQIIEIEALRPRA